MIFSFRICIIFGIPYIIRSIVASGLRFILSDSINLGPSSFLLEAIQSSMVYRVASYDSIKYSSWTPPPFMFSRNQLASNHYRLWLQNPQSKLISVTEIRLLVCEEIAPSEIVFTPSKVQVIVDVDSLRLYPTGDVMNCTIVPSLPSSLSLDYETCIVTGVTHEVMNQTFTVTAHMRTVIKGSFTIWSHYCNQSMFRVYRQWGASPFDEVSHIVNAGSKEVIYEEEANTLQQPNQLVITSFCFPPSFYSVSVSHLSNSFWDSNSTLTVKEVLPSGSELLLLKVHFDGVLSSIAENVFSTDHILNENTDWFYHYGSIPEGWYFSSFNHSDWPTSKPFQFPYSPNQIQLYRTSFKVETKDISFAYSFTMWLRFHYGCIVYLNNQLLYHRHLSSTIITNDTLATGMYEEVKYRRITFSIRTNNQLSGSLLTHSNILAVGLFATGPEQSESDFSCIFSVDNSVVSSAWIDHTVLSRDIDNAEALIDGLSNTAGESTSSSASFTITLNDDTRIWIGSIELLSKDADFSVSGFRLLAKNPEDLDWSVLHESVDWRWKSGVSTKIVPLNSTLSFNQFRFERFQKQPNVKKWVLYEMVLISHFVDNTSFCYSDNNTLYLNGGMGEIVPATNSVYSCTIDLPLPEGLFFDSLTCSIIGTPTVKSPLMEYSIQGISVWKGVVSTTLQLATDTCSSNYILISIDALLLKYDIVFGFSLYKVNDDGSYLFLFSSDIFRIHSTQYSHSFCLPYGLYAFSAEPRRDEGWEFPQGVAVSLNGGMLVEFTTLVPLKKHISSPHQFLLSPLFHEDSMLWEYWEDDDKPPLGWQTDSSTWSQGLLKEIKGHSLYLRAWVPLEDLGHLCTVAFSVLISGSLQMWLNGELVVNMTKFNSAKRIVFSFPLEENGAVQGLNRFAIEIHQKEESFSLMGQLSYGSESVLHNSILVSATSRISYPQSIVENDLGFYATLFSPPGAEFIFRIVNQIPRFNGYILRVGESVKSASWSLYARRTEEDPWNLMQMIVDHKLIDRIDNIIEIDQGMIGYPHWRLVFHSLTHHIFHISAFRLVYLHSNGSLCLPYSVFPGVRDGHISPAPCPTHYTGFAYRQCINGIFQELHLENCSAIPPSDLIYPANLTLYQYVVSFIPVLSVVGDVAYFQLMKGELPDGLIFDTVTGSIQGTPKVVVSDLILTISAFNRGGSTSTILQLKVLQKQCESEGPLPVRNLKDSYSFDCAVIGKGIGTQVWLCDLEGDQTVWRFVSGICIPSSLFFVFLILCCVTCLLTIRWSVQSFHINRKSQLKRPTKRDMFSKKQYHRLKSFIVCL